MAVRFSGRYLLTAEECDGIAREMLKRQLQVYDDTDNGGCENGIWKDYTETAGDPGLY